MIHAHRLNDEAVTVSAQGAGVVVELAEVVAGWFADIVREVRISFPARCFVGRVEAPLLEDEIAAAVDQNELERRMPLEDARKDQPSDGQCRFSGPADE